MSRSAAPNRDRLYITESATGTVLVADISVLELDPAFVKGNRC
jgi:hypothetical protein